MGRAPAIAAAAALLLLPARPAAAERARPGEVLVDRVVAVVEAARGEESEVVTLYELEVEARLVVAERARSLAAASADPPRSLLEAVLRTLVDQLLIRREAERLELGAVPEEDVARERERLEARLGGPGGLDRFREATGASEDLVATIIRRRAAVARFIARNVALSVRVTDAEVEAAHAAGGHPFAGRPLEEVREDLEAYLVARRQTERLSEWLRDLRSRTRVRVLAD